ncbi:MAG: hypothetical protein ABH808_03275 [Candidatus Kuenenbacteria bacterium]
MIMAKESGKEDKRKSIIGTLTNKKIKPAEEIELITELQKISFYMAISAFLTHISI